MRAELKPGSELRAVVFGAGGAIGGALVDTLANDSRIAEVHACARGHLDAQMPKVATHECDITQAGELAATADAIGAGGAVDLVIVATGVLHRKEDIFPEKTLAEIDAGRMAEVLRVNTVGPALVARYFLPLLRKKRRNVFAALSARVGSISDNRLGGWVSYRASKAALNMVLKTLSIEQARRNPESIVVGLHPGTVDSALSAPFQSNVPEGKLFAPAYAAGRLLQVIDGLGPGDTGSVFAWDGSRIEP